MVVTIIAEESSFRFRSDAFRPSKRKSTVRTTRTATRTATRTTRKRQTRRTTKKKTSCTYDDRYDDEAESSSIDDEEERHAQSSGILHCQRLSPRRQQHFAWLSSYSTGIVPTMDHLSATHGYRRDDDDEEEESEEKVRGRLSGEGREGLVFAVEADVLGGRGRRASMSSSVGGWVRECFLRPLLSSSPRRRSSSSAAFVLEGVNM
mmetsp:Transcript_3090/g.6591  ORF Transcript_3090/g.6591 Transcript_3090/m.6591 type:complete len:206 (-) Transcript_3090:77-694(-)